MSWLLSMKLYTDQNCISICNRIPKEGNIISYFIIFIVLWHISSGIYAYIQYWYLQLTIHIHNFFDPLLILWVCPLPKNGTVYNFNHRYMLTLRDRISQKIQNNNIVQILYIYYHIFTWNKYLIQRTIGLNTWWRNLFWQAQRSDVFCSFSAGLHRPWEGFWSTPLCRSSPNP